MSSRITFEAAVL